MRLSHRFLLVPAIVSVAACTSLPKKEPSAPAASAPTPSLSTTPSTKYYKDDGPGANAPPNLAAIPDAVPRVERLHRFADISSVEGFLEELATKATPLVVKLSRAAGSRESRWAHLLCGEVAAEATPAFSGEGGVSAGELSALKAELTRQGADLAALRELVERLARELGVQ